ncbi:MAG: polymerase sigma factor rpoD [Candidatus Saccharibacteria bacterium]|nr:polymerase sigma factor rpoD [Candidatus Saccharibacteria bacterium]
MIGERAPLALTASDRAWQAHPRSWLQHDTAQAIDSVLREDVADEHITPSDTPRLEAWSVQESAVKAMLGVSELPNQTITADEWAAFTQRIKAGDTSVAEEITMRRLRASYGVASYYVRKMGIPDNQTSLEDLFQIGYESIWSAIDRYHGAGDYTRPLDTFLSGNLVGAIKRSAQESGLVRIPVEQAEQLDDLTKAQEAAAEQHGLLDPQRAPLAALTEVLGWNSEKLEELPIYLDLQRSVYGGHRFLSESALAALPITEFDEVIPDEITLTERALAKESLKLLERRNRSILEHRIGGIGGKPFKTPTELSKIWNVIPERIRQIEVASLQKLRNSGSIRAYAANLLTEQGSPYRTEQDRVLGERYLKQDTRLYQSIKESDGSVRAAYVQAITDTLRFMGQTTITRFRLSEVVSYKPLPPTPDGRPFCHNEFSQAFETLLAYHRFVESALQTSIWNVNRT